MSQYFKDVSFIPSLFLLDFCIYKISIVIDFDSCWLLSSRPSTKYAFMFIIPLILKIILCGGVYYPYQIHVSLPLSVYYRGEIGECQTFQFSHKVCRL